MISEDNKLSRTRKQGYKPIVKKEQQKKDKLKKDFFDVDSQQNWLFPDDSDYTKKRKSKKKKNK